MVVLCDDSTHFRIPRASRQTMVLAAESLRHAALGAIVAGGGVAAVQSLFARKLQSPTSLALALGGFVGTRE